MSASPFHTMVSLQMQLFVYVIAGFVLTRAGTITSAGRKSLSDLLINFILPCNIVCSFQMSMTGEVLSSCAVMLLIACGAQLLYLVTSRACSIPACLVIVWPACAMPPSAPTRAFSACRSSAASMARWARCSPPCCSFPSAW